MKASSIHHFRTHQYRVFLAEPYFKLDLEEEIKWHEDHLRKLRLQAKNPHIFHRSRTSHKVDHHRERHFKEHVIESIPFHEKILSDHKKRLKTVLDIIPERKYKKIQKVSIKVNAVPDYFVFDRLNKKSFFVIDRPTPEKERWSKVVKKKKLCEVMFLE
ncbi:hypothetical protein KY349_05870 [Candidatus Woesearchaeota archaeon]|jgi:hypothetical protein|nr:hypothetical protein [Candidatus Woesearchaeota archaeon]